MGLRICQAKNLVLWIMFCDTAYQILLFDCDINVTRCDIFATLKKLTKQKRACESFVLRNLRSELKASRTEIKKGSRSPLSLVILITEVLWLIAICENLLPLTIVLLTQRQSPRRISSSTRNRNFREVKATRNKKTYSIITHIILLS